MGFGVSVLVLAGVGFSILQQTLGVWPAVGATLLVLGWTAWKGRNLE